MASDQRVFFNLTFISAGRSLRAGSYLQSWSGKKHKLVEGEGGGAVKDKGFFLRDKRTPAYRYRHFIRKQRRRRDDGQLHRHRQG